MNCSEARSLLDAYFDSELDLVTTVKVRDHVAACTGCASVLSNLEQLRDALTAGVFERAGAPQLQKLGERIRREIDLPARRSVQSIVWAAIAAGLLLAIWLPWRSANREDAFARELVDNHVRSLEASHLVDVPSSDQHTVKPWFQGKVDFAPEVADFASRGFELVGGRLDVLNGRPAAAIVYKRRAHYINAWQVRSSNGDSDLRFFTSDGYQMAHWSAGGLDHWLATDMNASELRTFAGYLRGR